MKHFPITAAEETLDGVQLCNGCDRPRTGVLAYCPDCEEVTPSYVWGCHPDAILHGRASELRRGELGICPVTVRKDGSVGA